MARGQLRFWVLLASLTLQGEGRGPSQCRCECSSHHLENWALEAGAASCLVMGSDALQARAVSSIPTLFPFPSNVLGPPTAVSSPSSPL